MTASPPHPSRSPGVGLLSSVALTLIMVPLVPFVSVSAVPNNCAAGGSAYGVAFDWNEPDTIGLLGSASHPRDAMTVEYWYRNTNLNADYAALHCYSAYNVRGYQGEGGDIYEAANEVQLAITPGFVRLWRGTTVTDLRSEVNPRAASFTTEWRHYAFTVDPETAEVAFYVDGDLLDFGYASIELGVVQDAGEGGDETIDGDGPTIILFETLPISNGWDKAEHPDAEAYYGRHEATAVLFDAEYACEGGNINIPPLNSNNDDNAAKAVALLRRTDKCSDYDQARNVAEAGAWAIIFEQASDEDLVDEEGGDGAEEGDQQESEDPPLSIPVLSVSTDDFNALETSSSAASITVTRTRQTYRPGTDLNKSVEKSGVLSLGQEPDAPWGDFDEFQSANAVVDEYRVWSTVRSPEQIKANYLLAIDRNSPDADDLAYYWTFNDEPVQIGDGSSSAALTTADSAPNGSNPGLLGALPTVENQLQYVTDRGKVPPTAPRRIPTTSSPVVGIGQEVVVPVVPGADTALELKSYDPDGDDLTTLLVDVPGTGRLFALADEEGDEGNYNVGAALSTGDEVQDPNADRTESKRVVYRAPSDFADDVTFTYTVDDGGIPVAATVRLVLHEMFQPEDRTETILEDNLVAFSLAVPSQVDQKNMRVEITALPDKGQLYQAQFNPGSYPSWTALAESVDQYGPMERIDSIGDVLNTDRGIVVYQPAKDEHSSSPDEVYTTFKYRFVDPSGLESSEAEFSIVVTAVNDPPVGVSGVVDVEVGGQAVIELRSTDVDSEAVESFAERPFSRIVAFPQGGRVYQYDEGAPEELSNRGLYMDASVTNVPQTFSWASRVVRYSSQFSLCGASCFSWRNPECPSNDVLSGGREDGTCSDTAWHASMILGEPDYYPGYADAKQGWDLSSENAGDEFIELEYPFEVYLSSFELYETFKPGSLWKISTTTNYVDDTERHCSGQGSSGIPKCSKDSDWMTLWTKPQESVTLTADSAQIFAPPLCPSTVKTRIVRLDLDTARAPGWNNFDAAKVTGSLDPPPGLLSDTSNRLVYVPINGVHGKDRLTFTVTDCLDVGEETEFLISISTPEPGQFSPSVFSTVDAVLDTTAGVVVDQNLDLSGLLQKIRDQRGEETEFTGTVWHTTALGATAGLKMEGMSLFNPTITLSLGTATMTPSKLELWLEDGAGLTFRILLMVKIHVECEKGTVDESRGVCVCTSPRWIGPSCSIEVSENRNEIPPAIKGVGYAMFAINLLIIFSCFVCVTRKRKDGPVKVAQPFFLYLLLGGCLLCNCTIVTLQVEESDGACVVRPWLWSLGFSIMFGAMFAKILRVYRVFKNGRAMRRKTVTITETMRPVVAVIVLNTIVLICWTAIDPLQWSRVISQEDGYGHVLSSYGGCASENDIPYLATLGALNGILMIVACVLSYKARHLPSQFQEGKYISLAVFSCIEIYFIGVPVIVIVQSNPSIAAFVQSAVIFLTTLAVLVLIYGPLLWNVYFGEREEERRSGYSVGSGAISYASGHQRTRASQLPSQFPSQLSSEAENTRRLSNESCARRLSIDPRARRLSNDAGTRRASNDSFKNEKTTRVEGDVEEGNSCRRPSQSNDEAAVQSTRRVSFEGDGNSSHERRRNSMDTSPTLESTVAPDDSGGSSGNNDVAQRRSSN